MPHVAYKMHTQDESFLGTNLNATFYSIGVVK